MINNPYSPHESHADSLPFRGFDDQKLFLENDLLVVRDGAVLPDRCIATGEKVDPENMSNCRFYWAPPILILLFLCGFLPFLFGIFFLRHRCTIWLGMSHELKSRILRMRILKFVLPTVTFFGIPFAAIEGSEIVLIVAIILFILSVIFVLVSPLPLNVVKYKDGYFWLRGCPPEIIKEISGEIVDDKKAL